MTLSKKPYKGTRDFFPYLKRKRDYLFSKMIESSESFGYEPYDAPLLEETDLYRAKSGEELINEQIYSMKDRGDRDIAIRPEMTPSVARMVAQIHREVAKPIRWYSIPNLMRYERPQRGRLREHWQLNCDIFGAPEGRGELELIQILIDLMKSYGADDSHFEILINDRKIVDCILGKILKIDGDVSHRIYKIIDQAKKISSDDLEKKIVECSLTKEQEDNLLKYSQLSSFNDLVDFLVSNNEEESCENLKFIFNALKELGLDRFVKYDPTIVRGLDYYTGIVFEMFDKNPENRRAICGGGAYENLLKIFNEKPLAGVGFGLGDVTLADFLETNKLMPNFEKPSNHVYISIQMTEGVLKMTSLAQKLRDKNLKVIFNSEVMKLKKSFSLCENAGAKILIVFGERELEKSVIQVKNMETKEQIELPLDSVEEIIKLI